MKNRKFQVVTDSSCDMPEAYYAEHDVECVKLGFNMDGVDYEGEEGERIGEHEFYEKLRAGAMPTTYQITGETAKKHIRPYLEQGKDVLVIAFSSGLSGTADSFALAARELSEEFSDRKILVVDSLCASMGEGLLVDYVIKKADEGASIEETAQYAEDLKLKICHNFTVTDLYHLKRGGRVSATTAIIGSMLKIKPIMHMNNEGKLIVIGKTMGRQKSLRAIVDRTFAYADITDDDPVFISHGDCIEDVETVKNLIHEKNPNLKIFVNYIGSVIGSHSGCGTLAVFTKGKTREKC